MAYYKRTNLKGELLEVLELNIDDYIEEQNSLSGGERLEQISEEEYNKLYDEIIEDTKKATDIFQINYVSPNVPVKYTDEQLKLAIISLFTRKGELPSVETLTSYFNWLKG